MRNFTAICLAIVTTAMLGFSSAVTPAHAGNEPYVIGAVFDVTGTGSPLGAPEEATVRMLEKQINAKGGINGHPLKVIYCDNASDEAKSVTAMKKLIESDKVLAIIGTSQTGTTLSGEATVEAAGIPMISCGSGVKIVQPVKKWIFKTAQSDVHAVAKVLDYLQTKRLSKIAVISVANAYGDSGKQQLEKQAPGAGIKIVEEESFGSADTDMTAQLMKIRRSDAQAVICWGTNPGPAIVTKNMRALGIKLPLIQSHGVANTKFIELAGVAAEGVIFPAGKIIVANEIPHSDKQRSVLLGYTSAYKKEYSREADTFGGHAYDAMMLIEQALKTAGADRAKIRMALESARLVGISGVFKFTPADHNGLAKDAFTMVKIVNGKWTLDR